jgi:hypothetical protein
MSRIIEVDCTTGVSIERDMTPEELADLEQRQAEAEANRIAQEEEEARVAANKESAQAKLAALGLTAEEISAIIS